MKDYFFGLNVVDEEERRAQGRYWLRLAVVTALAAGFLWAAGMVVDILLPRQARAETPIPVHVIDEDAVKAHLLSAPCSDPVSAMLVAQLSPPQFADRWRGLTSQWKHKDGTWHEYGGCWLELTKEEAGADEAVLFFTFADGTYGKVLKSNVVKSKGRGA